MKAEAIRQRVSEGEVQSQGQALPAVTVSLGGASGRGSGLQGEAPSWARRMTRCARAKAAGRKRMVLAGAGEPACQCVNDMLHLAVEKRHNLLSATASCVAFAGDNGEYVGGV